MNDYDCYILCTSPRSGSTLLCSLLAATGVSGNPKSYFHRPDISNWMEELGVELDPDMSEREVLRTVFQAVSLKGSGKTGMFGLRLQQHSFDFFVEKLVVLFPNQANDKERLQAAFGRTLFVHLTRLDKVEQAVSYVKAQQSGLWHLAHDGTELERLSPHQEPAYDRLGLHKCYESMKAYDRNWQDWFRKQGIEPYRISYEALALDPIKTLSQLLDRLGIGREAALGVEVGVKKLADCTNHNWSRQFRTDLGLTSKRITGQ
jgi:trehalose 2-sulfotransferase